MRRRLSLPRGAVLAAGVAGPAAAAVALPRNRLRYVGVCALQMWAYVAAYKMPYDDPERLLGRVRVGYPIAADRIIGLGEIPSTRLQRRFARPGRVGRFERVLVWSHWMWFMVPHASIAYVLLRTPDRFPSAAARMYAVFDTGAVLYWMVPTAPPWWAAANGHLGELEPARVRRMMLEYGERFWGERWSDLYDVLGGNPLAAMPSLHFATSLMAARLLAETDPVAGAVGWLYAATLGLTLVYLGEHYAADLAGGAALAEAVRRIAPHLAAPAAGVARTVNALQARAAG